MMLVLPLSRIYSSILVHHLTVGVYRKIWALYTGEIIYMFVTACNRCLFRWRFTISLSVLAYGVKLEITNYYT